MFGVPDERLGEVPGAVVYSEDDGTLTQEALIAHTAERLAQYKVPVHWWIQDEPLPKLGTGKIDKKSLRERYQAELDRR